MAAKVVSFGEIMLRLSPPGFERLFQSPSLVATFGGGEANVAVSLAQFGLDSWYVTRLPKNPIGDAAVRALRAEGVHTEAIARGGDRVGIYFAESGASQRASVVVYDRARVRRVPDWTKTEVVADQPAGEWRRIQRADGYHWTLVNGAITFESGSCTGATPGRLIRHGH